MPSTTDPIKRSPDGSQFSEQGTLSKDSRTLSTKNREYQSLLTHLRIVKLVPKNLSLVNVDQRSPLFRTANGEIGNPCTGRKIPTFRTVLGETDLAVSISNNSSSNRPRLL
jgi:hypothetical protein